MNENQTATDIESGEDDGEENDICNNKGTDTEISSTPSNITADTAFKLPITTEKLKATNINLIENRMEDAYNILKQVSVEPSRDECSLYIELLEKKLRSLDESTREIAMLDIDNYLYRLKHNRNHLNYQNNYTSINSTQSFQTHPSHLYDYSTYSSQSLHNQLPIQYMTHPFASRPTQENVSTRISPQNHTPLNPNYLCNNQSE